MNPNSRTIKVIETSLHRLEQDVAHTPSDEATALAAVGLLDEIRRLERKWVEQVAAGSRRRKPTDFCVMEGWCRRWLRATGLLADLPADVRDLLNGHRAAVERDLQDDRFRTAAATMRGEIGAPSRPSNAPDFR